MEVGRLRHRVTLQRPGGTRDAVGERQTTWTDVATVWADIRPTSTGERNLAGQNNSFMTHRITVRYGSEWAAMDGSWRVLYGSRIFTVDGVPRNLEEDGRWIEIVCVESKAEE